MPGNSVYESRYETPHTLDVRQSNVYGSHWPATANGTEPGVVNLWTIVNRAGRDFDGDEVQLTIVPKDVKTSRFFDCYAGVEIEALPIPSPPAPPVPPPVPPL